MPEVAVIVIYGRWTAYFERENPKPQSVQGFSRERRALTGRLHTGTTTAADAVPLQLTI